MEIIQFKIRHDCDTGYHICNRCGRIKAKQEINRLTHDFGYHSKWDMSKLDLALCNECTDAITDMLIKLCMFNPIVG